VRQRIFYSCIGYETGLFMAVIIQLFTGWPFSLLNLLGLVGVLASVTIAEYNGKAPTLEEVNRPLSLLGYSTRRG
jgi:hypothetical protein